MYTRDLQYSCVVSLTKTSLITCLRFSAFDGCLYVILSFAIFHRFSIGLRYGVFTGHSSADISFFFRNSVATYDRCKGAPSCMTMVERLAYTSSFYFSMSKNTYLGPFIVVLGGRKYRPLAPRHDMAPQIVWFGECFIMAIK